MVQFVGFVAAVAFVCNVLAVNGLPLTPSSPNFVQQQQPMFNQFGNQMPFRQVAPSVMMQNPYAAPAPMAFNAPAAPSAGYGAPAAAAAAPAAAPAGYGAPAAAAAAPAATPAAYDLTPAAYAYEEEANETLVEKSEAETAKPDCYYSQGPPSTPATIFRWPTAVQPTFGFPMRDVGSQFMQPAQPMQSFQPMRDVNGVQFMQPVQSMQTLQPQSLHPMQSMQTLQPMSSMQTLQPMPSMQSMQNMQQMQQMQSMQAAQPTFHSVGSPMTASGFGQSPMAPTFTGQREVLGSQFTNPNPMFPANNMAFNGFNNFNNLNHPALNNQGIFNRVN